MTNVRQALYSQFFTYSKPHMSRLLPLAPVSLYFKLSRLPEPAIVMPRTDRISESSVLLSLSIIVSKNSLRPAYCKSLRQDMQHTVCAFFPRPGTHVSRLRTCGLRNFRGFGTELIEVVAVRISSLEKTT
jgi:hypothetical protein